MSAIATDLVPRVRAAAELAVSPRTLDRWHREGLRGVQLPLTYRGGRVYVSRAALAAFQRQVDAARQRRPAGARVRKRDEQEARERLRAHGVRTK